MKEEYNTYDYELDKNIKSSINKYSKDYIKINSTTMRISVLEDRTKSLEKMLRLFEERLNIKEEEKLNELKNLESNVTLINKLNKKIKNLEKQLIDITNQKKISDEQNEKKILDLNDRIKTLEEQIKSNNEKENNDNNINNDTNNNDTNNNMVNEDESANIILNDFNEILKNNNLQMDEIIQEKIYNSNIDNENKINELLNLIHDINKILEENENKINLINKNFTKFQNDNINIIQMLSIQEEKINNIDFLNDEIHKLKIKINDLASYLDDKNEEEKFTKQFLNSIRIK